MIDLSSAFHKNGLCFLTEEKDEHSALYLKVRQAEHRVLSDEQVSKLPKTEKNYSLAKDWKLRTNTLHRFTTYLNKSKKPLTILEIGCGNGWFSHQLSLLPNAKQVL
ncbi:MAG: hypothetical protein ACPGTG_02870, partial [Flavobacteriales bacterium]